MHNFSKYSINALLNFKNLVNPNMLMNNKNPAPSACHLDRSEIFLVSKYDEKPQSIN